MIFPVEKEPGQHLQVQYLGYLYGICHHSGDNGANGHGVFAATIL